MWPVAIRINIELKKLNLKTIVNDSNYDTYLQHIQNLNPLL